MAITKRLRYEILKRDNHACRYCGCRAPEVKLTVDHVLPVALGGSDEPENLVAACRDCNSGKSSTKPTDPLVADIDAQQLAAKAALAQAIEDRRAQMEADDSIVDEVYRWWGTYADDDSYGAMLWMIRAGLALADFRRATAIASGKRDVPLRKQWSYFMGVCRNMVRETQESAEQIMHSQSGGGNDPHCGHCQACLYPEDEEGACRLEDEALECPHCDDPTCIYSIAHVEGFEEAAQEFFMRYHKAISHYRECSEVNHG